MSTAMTDEERLASSRCDKPGCGNPATGFVVALQECRCCVWEVHRTCSRCGDGLQVEYGELAVRQAEPPRRARCGCWEAPTSGS